MKLFQKKNAPKSAPGLIGAQRGCAEGFDLPAAVQPYEKELYDRLRCAVPIIDAAIMKIIRLTGGFRVICSDESFQQELDSFLAGVPVGLTGRSVGCFADNFLDSLLTYGRAVGEIVTDNEQRRIAGLWNGDISKIRISAGADPFSRSYTLRAPDGTSRRIAHPERIVYAELTGGNSLLRGLPSLSGILMRIYQCIGQNYDRAGNIRYAVTYKPTGEASDVMFTRERAQQIAREWADGMNSAKYGQVKDFVAVGDVDIKVIGAENQLFDTNVPVRQILEQLIAKLSIPPFLLGLSWSSTERMSSQQADILTSELEYYRRLLTPVICDVGNAYLASVGAEAVCTVEWDNINLQDETALAEARLKNAQAKEIELRLEKNQNGG
ncbi:MAG: serine/threonine protein phosphatase [Ruminococcus sp.]|uniref:serine/threonine protein phosphatase n=1 Tax=Ruminococcus sp. TaxID=41978 RepID=UPI0025EB5A5D|nr:serine/threonine protein phosphatase [Ruminococcus sp.]MBR6995472.1 serine/threonine protein phosphatase [Ruminococcus sp.]